MADSIDLVAVFQKAQGPDAAAVFEKIVARYVDLVYSVARRKLRDEHLARDATQEVFLIFAHKASSLRAGVALGGWFFQTARLVCLTMLRAQRRRLQREREVAMAEHSSGDAAVWSAIAGEVDDAVSRLARRDREVVALRFFEGRSHQEIAARLAISEDAAKKRTERALDALRILLGAGRHRITGIALAGMLQAHAVEAAPAGMPQAVTAAVSTGIAPTILAHSAGAAGGLAKIAAVIAIAAAVTVPAIMHLWPRHSVRAPIPVVAVAASAPSTPPYTGPAIQGDVVGSDGNPVVGATVGLVARHEKEASVTTQTGADGRFTLALTAKHSQVFACVAGVGVSKPVFATGTPAHLALLPAIDLRLHFLSPEGTPAAGLTVHPTIINMRDDLDPFGGLLWADTPLQAAFSGTTDATGTCVIHGLPRDARIRLDTDDARYACFSPMWETVLSAPGTMVDAQPLRLLQAARITGTLIASESHAPLAGVQIGAQAPDGSVNGGWGEATTDAAGNFTVGRLSPGKYVLSVLEEEHVDRSWAAAAVDIGVAEGETKQAAFVVTPGGILSGVVRDAVTHRGIAGLSVGLHGPAKPDYAGSVYMHVTEADGHFHFRVPPGEQHPYVGSAVPEGYLEPPQQGMQHVAVAEGRTVDIAFDLQPDPSPVVEVTVTDTGGHAAAQAVVTFEYPGDMNIMSGHSVTADDHGKAKLHARPGTLVRARWNDMATARALKLFDDAPVDLQVQLKPTFSIVVTIAGPDGKPVPGATASLDRMGITFGEGGFPRLADGAGHVTFSTLPLDGAYTLFCTAPGYGETQKKIAPPAAGGGEKKARVVLTPATASIAGIVVDADGHPLPGVTVTINGYATGARETVTDAAGHFAFAVVPGATTGIALRSPSNLFFESQNVRAGDDKLKLVYPRDDTRPPAARGPATQPSPLP